MTSLVVPARSVAQATPRTRVITADLDNRPFSFEAGQAVNAGLAESSVRRPFSIACSPRQAEAARAIELLVQVDDHSAPDPHLERVAPGTLLYIEGPFGSFRLPTPLAERHLLLVAGGTGIAPLRAILWDVLEQTEDSDRIDIAVAYSARSPEEFAFRDELEALHASGRIRLALTVTRDSGVPWRGARGRITPAFLESLLKTPDTRCLICGPPALSQEAARLLRAAGVPDDKIQEA